MREILITLLVILSLLIGNTSSYEITTDRSLDDNCLAYSKEVRDELITKGENAYLVGFQYAKEPGHCMVVVNPYTVNYTVIESYTGREFKMGKPFDRELDCYLKDLVGGFPDSVWIFLICVPSNLLGVDNRI